MYPFVPISVESKTCELGDTMQPIFVVPFKIIAVALEPVLVHPIAVVCGPYVPRGTYFANGPDVADSPAPLSNVLDGNGRVLRVRFGPDGVRMLSRAVETSHREKEARAGRLLYRHAFGSGPRLSMQLKHSANTNFMVHNRMGLALFEGGHPYLMDPETLDTCGQSDLGGLARQGLPASTGCGALDSALGLGGDAVLAHARRDPCSGSTSFMLLRHEPRGTR